MPQLISREQALDEISKQAGAGTCLVCGLVKNEQARLLYQSAQVSVILSGYPRFWGQVMICLNRHAERYSEIAESEWQEISRLSLHYAKLLERQLQPVRVYISALGSTQPLLQTCPHLHVNVLPVYDEQIKPPAVFTWDAGVYAGTPAEWEELVLLLKA